MITKLNNWAIVYDCDDPYTPPECRGTRLVGDVYGHPRKEDGKRVMIGRVVKFDKETKQFTTESGTVYELGNVLPEYAQAYPDCEARVYKRLEMYA